jgi:hypothetical protein
MNYEEVLPLKNERLGLKHTHLPMQVALIPFDGMKSSYYGKAKALKILYFPQPLARYPQPKLV